MRPKMDGVTINAHAVVMGLTVTGLSIARSLGRKGVRVIGVSPEPSPAVHSRFLTYIQEIQAESDDERLNFYVNLGKKFERRPVILPTLDPNVMFLSSNRKILEKYFRFILPSHQLLKMLTSKLGLLNLAEKHMLPLPSCILVKNKTEIEEIPSNFFPCVIKPDSQHAWLSDKAIKFGVYGLKALPATDHSELLKQYNRVKDIDSILIVQKMIVGPESNHLDYHAFVDSKGRISSEFVGKKLRLTPPHFGMGCYVESVSSEKVINEGRRILRILNYKGMANINFKKDDRNGRLYFLELNPRFSFWTELDVMCGVDFPYYYYRACFEEQIETKEKYQTGKRWLSLLHDIKGLKVRFKDGSLSLHQWLSSVLKADIGAIFSNDDPLPAIMLPFYVIKLRIKMLIVKLKNNRWFCL